MNGGTGNIKDETAKMRMYFRIPWLISGLIFLTGISVFYFNTQLDKYQFRQTIQTKYVRDLEFRTKEILTLMKSRDTENKEITPDKILALLQLDKDIQFIAFYNKAHKIIIASDQKYNNLSLNKIAPAELAVVFGTHYRFTENEADQFILEAVIHFPELEYSLKMYGIYVRIDLSQPIIRLDNRENGRFFFAAGIILFISVLVSMLLNHLISRPIKNIVLNETHKQGRSFFEIKELINYLQENRTEDKNLLQKKIDSENRLRRLVLKLEQEIVKRNVRLTNSQGKIKKEAEQRWRLEEQARKMSRILEYSPTSIMITNLEGNIEYVNPRFSEVTGYTFEEAEGQNPRLLKSGEMSADGYKELWDTITAGEVWRGLFHNKKKNGDLYWELSHIAPVKNDKGEVTHYIAIKEDITKQKEAEEVKLMYAKALQSIGEMVTITDLDNRFVYLNEAFLKTYGYTSQEIIGKSADILLSEENPERVEQRILESTLTNNGWSGELLNKSKSGRVFPVFLTASVIKDEKGTSFALVGISRDVSLEKEAMELDKKTEMLHMVQELAAAVSHEFSQPLQALENYIGLMKMGQSKKRYINKIEGSVKRIAELVKNLRETTGLKKQDYLDTQILDLKASTEINHSEEPMVLVVDDEEAIQETLTEMISLSGYQCDGASDGLEALKMVSKNKYQLIISDVNMPRMSGTVLFDKLKAIGYSGVFIFMTGYDMSNDTEKIIQKGDGLLHKPVSSQTLVKIIQSVFKKEDKV